MAEKHNIPYFQTSAKDATNLDIAFKQLLTSILKNEDLQDKIESLKEITRADIVGALDREVQVNLDMYKMQIADVAMYDVMNAIGNENVTISGGSVKMDGLLREINVVGQYVDARKIGDLAIRSASGAIVYLRDIAEVKDGFKEQESFARLEHKNVITLNIVKKSGQNLIDASDKIRKINEEMKKAHFPEGLKITITGDQSDKTRTTLHDLINTIVIGFILVTIILMFFMGATNALFVAMSVPLSMAIAFLFLPVNCLLISD